jgi:hypothetical protein
MKASKIKQRKKPAVAGAYSVEDTAVKIGKSKQTVRSYVKRGLLTLAESGSMGFWITKSSIDTLPSLLHGSLQNLRKQRSEYMRQKWDSIKAVS